MSVDPTRYTIGPDAVIEDVDLDEEDIRLPDGTRLTEQRAGQLAQEALAEIRRRNLVPGRKSLSGGSVHSPRVQFRVPEEIRERAEQRAAAEGKSLSALAREALERYLEAS
jgi:predicted HicB family RNase H-like nuclease